MPRNTNSTQQTTEDTNLRLLANPPRVLLTQYMSIHVIASSHTDSNFPNVAALPHLFTRQFSSSTSTCLSSHLSIHSRLYTALDPIKKNTTNKFLCFFFRISYIFIFDFRMLTSVSGNTAEGFLSKSPPSAAAARSRRVVIRRHKQLLVAKPQTKSCSSGGRETKAPPSEKMNPSKSKPGASSSSSTPFRRLDGDINREAGIPLTGQEIVGKDNKARGVNCSAHGSISVVGRRREMEDRLTVAPNDFPATHDFFGVYDGHGGARVSSACRDRLHKLVGERVERWSGRGDFEWERQMKECFRRMDEEVNAEEGGGVGLGGAGLGVGVGGEPKVRTDGSMALVAVLGKDEIVVANCGDSRAVLYRNGMVIPLSWDQKPDRPDERHRVESAGGRIIDMNGLRVLGVLKATRSIGDRDLKPFMISEPEVTVTKCSELDNFLIIASDGLWDAVSNEDACEVVKECLDGQTRRILGGEFTKNPAVAAAMLAELAMAKGSKDNISVIVVEFKNKTHSS